MIDAENKIEDVLRDAERLFETLKAAGIAYIPVKKAETPLPPAASISAAPVDAVPVEPGAWSAKVGFEARAAVVFGLWRIGPALFAAGRAVRPGDTNPFPEDESVQAQKLLGWFAGEIKAGEAGEPLILSATAMRDGADMAGGAFSVKPLLDEKIGEWRPSVIVALGGLASLLLAGSVDAGRLRGRFHSCNGVKCAVTHSPEDLVKRPGLKKETLEDMKSVIRALA